MVTSKTKLIDFEAEQTPIVVDAPTLTENHVSAFRQATLTQYSNGFVPTYATIFRRAEFMWLDRMKVDLRNLLHTDQEYVYHTPFEIGDVPQVTTSLQGWKEKRGMFFVTLETVVECQGNNRVSAVTTFVIRDTSAARDVKSTMNTSGGEK